MKKKSKGRVRKYEQENNILSFPDDAARGFEDPGSDELDRYDTQALYTTPLYGNEGYDDPDYEPERDFTRNESYEPSADFDIDAMTVSIKKSVWYEKSSIPHIKPTKRKERQRRSFLRESYS